METNNRLSRPDRLNIFWDDWDDPDDPDDHMETRLKIKIRKRTLFDAWPIVRTKRP